MSDNKNIKQTIKKLPDSTGVYLMENKSKEIIYIGKATSLKKRVNFYFTKALDNKTAKLVSEIKKIDYRKTDSVVEALILESNLIAKYQPKYNIKLKDDKSFANIIITDEEYPRVLVTRPTDKKKIKAKHIFGPYTSKQEAEKVINLLVKMFNVPKDKFTYADNLIRTYYIKGYSLGKIGNISKENYKKIIRSIRMFLEGRKTRIIKRLEKEMLNEAKAMNFEKASKIRDQIFALSHIRDLAFIKENDVTMKAKKKFPARAEAYDISNISGKFAAGSIIVFTNGKPDKNEYRKFRIKTVEDTNDIAMLREVLERRFAHTDWQFPDLLVIDGGLGQKNAIQMVLRKYKLDIPIVSIAKGPTRKGEKLFFSAPKGYIFPDIEFIKKMRDEAHRFAISYHRRLRSKIID